MKRTIYSLILCMTLLVVSCSDNKNSTPNPLTPSEIAGSYAGAKAIVQVNGKSETPTIVVSGTALDAMTIVLPANLVTAADLSVPVKFSQFERASCLFTGAMQVSGLDVTLDGILINGVLKLNIHTVKSNITPDKIAGKYTATAAVKVSGIAYEMSVGEAIEISGTDLAKMTITVPERVVPGEGVLTFTDVEFKLTDGCSFEKIMTATERDIKIDGTFANGNLVLNITPKYKSELVGTWGFEAPNMIDEYTDISTVLICNVVTPTGKIIFFGSEQDQEYLNIFINGLVGQMILRSYVDGVYTGALQNVKFHADGNLTAEYNSKFMQVFEGNPFVESPMGAMRWYLKGGKIFLVPNLNLMTKGISRDGLPMEITLDNGKVTIYVTKNEIAPVMALLSPIVLGLPDSMLGDYTALVKMLVGELGVIAQEATKLDFGVRFKKAK